jgi:hypothetical protein
VKVVMDKTVLRIPSNYSGQYFNCLSIDLSETKFKRGQKVKVTIESMGEDPNVDR